MTNYNNGRIYKILNNIDDDVYVGSTTEPLCKRMWKHKWDVKNHKFKTRPLYVKMLENGFDNFYIELIEHYNCNSKEELRAKEGEWIRKIGTLNVAIAGRTGQEYRKDNAEYFAKKSLKYYYEHHDEQLEMHKARRERKKEYLNEAIQCVNCGCTVARNGIARHKKTKKCTNHINM